eukprot:8079-Heterococcus_DN1.PRE.2
MTHGPFGGVNRDLLAVQSMDGRLQVFEQDAHAFTRRLGTPLLPGPLCYVARTDSFVTATSEMCIECYKYQALAASQAESSSSVDGSSSVSSRLIGDSSSASGIARGRSVQVQWSLKVGEGVTDIFVAKFSADASSSSVASAVAAAAVANGDSHAAGLQQAYVVMAAAGAQASRPDITVKCRSNSSDLWSDELILNTQICAVQPVHVLKHLTDANSGASQCRL